MAVMTTPHHVHTDMCRTTPNHAHLGSAIDVHRATYMANMRLAQAVTGSRSTAIDYRDTLNVTAACFLHTCAERTAEDKAVSLSQFRHKCIGCGLLRADWNPHHPGYLADATECPECRTR